MIPPQLDIAETLPHCKQPFLLLALSLAVPHIWSEHSQGQTDLVEIPHPSGCMTSGIWLHCLNPLASGAKIPSASWGCERQEVIPRKHSHPHGRLANLTSGSWLLLLPSTLECQPPTPSFILSLPVAHIPERRKVEQSSGITVVERGNVRMGHPGAIDEPGPCSPHSWGLPFPGFSGMLVA